MSARAKNGDYLSGLGPAEVDVPGVRIAVAMTSAGEVTIRARFRRNATSSEVNAGLREIGIRARRIAFVRQINAEASERVPMRYPSQNEDCDDGCDDEAA